MHPNGLPDLFVDRSLGRVQVPKLLRDAGLRLVTLAEHYGVPADEDVEDTTWLELVGQRQWVALMKDSNIKRRPAEKQALLDHTVRAFCLAGGNLTAHEMGARYIRALPAMTRACAHDRGPFLYAVRREGIARLSLAEAMLLKVQRFAISWDGFHTRDALAQTADSGTTTESSPAFRSRDLRLHPDTRRTADRPVGTLTSVRVPLRARPG